MKLGAAAAGAVRSLMPWELGKFAGTGSTARKQAVKAFSCQRITHLPPQLNGKMKRRSSQ